MQSIRRWKAESIPRMLSIWSLNGKSPLVKSWTIGIKSYRHLKAQKEGAHIIHNLNLFHTCLPAHALTTTKNCSVLDNWKFRTRHSARARAAPRKHRTMFCFRQLPTQPKQKVVFLIGLLLSALLLLFFFIFYLFLRVFVISEFVIGLSILNFTGKFDGSGNGFQEAPFRPWNGAVQVGDRGTATRRACSSQQALQIFIHFTRGLSSFLIDTYTCTRGCNSFNFWIRGVLNDVI